jgi:hypothetical protein
MSISRRVTARGAKRPQWWEKGIGKSQQAGRSGERFIVVKGRGKRNKAATTGCGLRDFDADFKFFTATRSLNASNTKGT